MRERLRSLVPPPFAPVFEGDEVFLWARERRPGTPLVVLAGHYDTVPAQENLPGRISEGAVHGCGASDMKGGVAVALEIVREVAEREPGPVDVALLLFGREELPPQHNPLPALFEASSLALEADLAILLEPTDLTIQAGCVGNLSARVTFHGSSGHSARPWLAENALHRAIEGLARVAAHERREAVIDGLAFYEVVSVTRLEGGVADNVVPDRAVATLNLRYPPGPDAGRGRRAPAVARPDRHDDRGRRQLTAGGRRRRCAARPGAARFGWLLDRAEAGVDERGRLRVAWHTGGQLRARRDTVRAPSGRARRDRCTRAGLRCPARDPARWMMDRQLARTGCSPSHGAGSPRPGTARGSRYVPHPAGAPGLVWDARGRHANTDPSSSVR